MYVSERERDVVAKMISKLRIGRHVILEFIQNESVGVFLLVHALNQLTHARSCIMIFLLVIFFINCTRLKARAINEKNDSKKSHNALEPMR